MKSRTIKAEEGLFGTYYALEVDADGAFLTKVFVWRDLQNMIPLEFTLDN